VTVQFGGIQALSEVSLSVPPGMVCGVIGPNGAGKTTLFDVISGLRLPKAGRVRIDGRDVTDTSAVDRARTGLRRTFQRQQIFSQLSVHDNVLAALEWRGGRLGILGDLVAWPSRRRSELADHAAVARVLDLCGLTGIGDEPAGALPIGLARMVELARAIVDDPKVLLLDEPTSGLDQAEVARLGVVVGRIRSEIGAAILVIEHDMAFVMEQSDHVVALHLGQVLAAGTPAAIQRHPEVQSAYLG
jgi:branched-chain amino acid transport system ATP-binding protein